MRCRGVCRSAGRRLSKGRPPPHQSYAGRRHPLRCSSGTPPCGRGRRGEGGGRGKVSAGRCGMATGARTPGIRAERRNPNSLLAWEDWLGRWQRQKRGGMREWRNACGKLKTTQHERRRPTDRRLTVPPSTQPARGSQPCPQPLPTRSVGRGWALGACRGSHAGNTCRGSLPLAVATTKGLCRACSTNACTDGSLHSRLPTEDDELGVPSIAALLNGDPSLSCSECWRCTFSVSISVIGRSGRPDLGCVPRLGCE